MNYRGKLCFTLSWLNLFKGKVIQSNKYVHNFIQLASLIKISTNNASENSAALESSVNTEDLTEYLRITDSGHFGMGWGVQRVNLTAVTLFSNW